MPVRVQKMHHHANPELRFWFDRTEHPPGVHIGNMLATDTLTGLLVERSDMPLWLEVLVNSGYAGFVALATRNPSIGGISPDDEPSHHV